MSLPADPTQLRDRVRRAIATAGGWDVDALEPHDFQAETTAVLGVVQAELESLERQLGNALAAARHNVEQLGLAGAEIERLAAEVRDLEETAAEAQQNAVHWQEQLAAARTTGRRLNLRCQQAESKLATLKRIVGEWLLAEMGTYVPLRSITAIAKLAGRDIEDDRYVLHYQRVQGLEDAAARAARILLRATANRASSRTALLELDSKEA